MGGLPVTAQEDTINIRNCGDILVTDALSLDWVRVSGGADVRIENTGTITGGELNVAAVTVEDARQAIVVNAGTLRSIDNMTSGRGVRMSSQDLVGGGDYTLLNSGIIDMVQMPGSGQSTVEISDTNAAGVEQLDHFTWVNSRAGVIQLESPAAASTVIQVGSGATFSITNSGAILGTGTAASTALRIEGMAIIDVQNIGLISVSNRGISVLEVPATAAVSSARIYNNGTILSTAGDAVRLSYADGPTATGDVINYGTIIAQDHLNQYAIFMNTPNSTMTFGPEAATSGLLFLGDPASSATLNILLPNAELLFDEDGGLGGGGIALDGTVINTGDPRGAGRAFSRFSLFRSQTLRKSEDARPRGRWSRDRSSRLWRFQMEIARRTPTLRDADKRLFLSQ